MLQRRPLPVLVAAATLFTGFAVHAQEQLTGMFRLTRQTPEIVEPAFVEALEKVISQDEKLQWQVYVPESYDASRPSGLLVFLDPDGHGRMPDHWQQTFTSHNMIWIGARTGPRASPQRLAWQAILGSRAIARDYAIDPRRMYVAGAQNTVVSAIDTMLIANEFSGAIYIRGSF